MNAELLLGIILGCLFGGPVGFFLGCALGGTFVQVAAIRKMVASHAKELEEGQSFVLSLCMSKEREDDRGGNDKSLVEPLTSGYRDASN